MVNQNTVVRVGQLFAHMDCLNVWFGWVSNATCPTCMRLLTWWCQPTTNREFGRTVLEALSVGKPVVAFSHGGVDEIMSALFPEGKVQVGNDEALAQCIDSFLSQKPEVKPHQMFTNSDMFEKTLAVYQHLVVGDSAND